jgi:hypothetical protein
VSRSAQPEPCHEFRHIDGRRHACHRDPGHRGEHHSDGELRWGKNPHARRTRMSADPCPNCEPIEGVMLGRGVARR